jgi:subtilase family serine protease
MLLPAGLAQASTASSRAATASAGIAPAPNLQVACTIGAIRCNALIRTDLSVAGAQAAHSGFGPADLHAAYNLPVKGGAGRTVAIVDAYDDPNAEADLAVYRAYYNLPPCTTANGCFRKVNQSGLQSNYPRPDPQWAEEISLDLDMVSAICSQCHILLVEANSADESSTQHDTHSDLGASVSTAAFLNAAAISNSYGSVGPEPDERTLDGYYNHPGIAVTASSGDFGYGVNYPASSPYVISVGGTSLAQSATPRGWTETVWGSGAASQVPEAGGGTGSGCSQFEPKPAWQHDAGCAGRTVADVSAIADPNTGVAVYDSYAPLGMGWMVFGGTSVSSPITASVFALAGNYGRRNDPRHLPYLHPTSLSDVTTGSNASVPTSCSPAYLCNGEVGYDGPTGLGTPWGLRAF